jgi:hypothetical protein
MKINLNFIFYFYFTNNLLLIKLSSKSYNLHDIYEEIKLIFQNQVQSFQSNQLLQHRKNIEKCLLKRHLGQYLFIKIIRKYKLNK